MLDILIPVGIHTKTIINLCFANRIKRFNIDVGRIINKTASKEGIIVDNHTAIYTLGRYGTYTNGIKGPSNIYIKADIHALEENLKELNEDYLKILSYVRVLINKKATNELKAKYLPPTLLELLPKESEDTVDDDIHSSNYLNNNRDIIIELIISHSFHDSLVNIDDY